MQAPQRKGKYTSTLKGVHAEQLSKLQHKHQQELDLLDDIRLFSKQRASIEKEYAQALVKLGEQFITRRKFPPPPNLKSKDGKDYKTIWTVWKTVLEETRRVGDMRLQAADTYLQQISEPAKPLKASKSQVAKKVFEQFSTLHREISLTVQDLTKSHKAYTEEEHVAHEARAKAIDAESKVKNKSTGLFTSLAKLQQASNKLNIRREGCEAKSTSTRNEYLINLAAANAHSSRYYNTDLPLLIKTLDGEMYEKVQDYFTTLARSELECCGLTQECFMKILTDSCLVSREFNLQCFLHENQAYTNVLEYKYEAQDDDAIKTVSSEHNAKEQMDNETRKWTNIAAKESHRLRVNQKNMELLVGQIANGDVKAQNNHEGGSIKGDKGSVSSQSDPEQRLEDLKNSIRRSETNKLKAESVLETLREGGVDVDSWLSKAETQAEKEIEEESMRRSVTSPSTKALETQLTKSTSSRTESENTSETQSVHNTSTSQAPAGILENTSETQSVHNTSTSQIPAAGDTTYINYEEDDYADEAFESGQAKHVHNPSVSTGYASMSTTAGKNYPMACIAIYDFKADNGDELNLTEQEQLEIISEGDGDGWVRARNKAGQEGLVPENYIQLYDAATTTNGNQQLNGVDQNEMNVDSDIPYTVPDTTTTTTTAVAVDPVTDTVNAWGDSTQQNPQDSGEFSPLNGGDTTNNTDTMGSGLSNYSSTDYEVQQNVAEQPNTKEGDWVRAMYDYDATCEEELSFQEGQLVRITRRDENGVDDGWWEGELNGKVGVFPSLVVEEVANSKTQGATSPGERPGPPSFVPPENPPHLELTQPTPTDEAGGDTSSSANHNNNTDNNDTTVESATPTTTQSNDENLGNESEQDELTSVEYSDERNMNTAPQITVEADVHVSTTTTTNNDSAATNENQGENDKPRPQAAKSFSIEEPIAFADDENSESVI